ncbi:hypothetical protein ANN_23060 [Periplaneta americana]|uniref:Uncharacterized protein n=1 Tax=Periplaneta americana TaxID=6978 RepID=A0ABQ8SKG5_PERAM|nr:hypothetical protein ANN_23060 [Periplaneta americana]
MPRSPRKQRATVVKLVTKYGVPLENKVLAIKSERLSDDVTNLIIEFYVNDEISRVDPSLKGGSSQRFITTARRHLSIQLGKSIIFSAEISKQESWS